MSKPHVFFIATILSVFSFAFSAAAQVNNPNTQHPRTVRAKQEPCWQQVGISKDVIDQRDAIQQDTHSQVQSVCADTSLTPQQKKQKIREIHQEAKQKMSGLISEEQQQQLEACRKERTGNSPVATGAKHPGAGPCEELATPNGGQTGSSGAESH
jgi:hypothetical protein